MYRKWSMRASGGGAGAIGADSGIACHPASTSLWIRIRAASGERLGFAKGAYVRLPQPGYERGEYSGGGEAVTEGVVPILDRHIEPIRQ